jgi:hypothetical protein
LEFYGNGKIVSRNVLDLRISCDLQLKKKKRYKVKLKLRRKSIINCKEKLVDEFFMVSKKIKKLFVNRNRKFKNVVKVGSKNCGSDRTNISILKKQVNKEYNLKNDLLK